MSDRRALIAGATGIVGNNLASHLLSRGWSVYGISRRARGRPEGVAPIAADLTEASKLRTELRGLDITHVFFCTWARCATEAENCRVNGAMLRNLLQAIEPAPNLRHVALVTGLKHYLGPFEAYGHSPPETPFREDQPRLPYQNFYYLQEDILLEASARRGFSWSVHRPHTVIGWAIGNVMNMGVTLAAYGTICRETGRPFVFPGCPAQYDGVTDVTDARVLARHLEWAATTPEAANEALNVVNGDLFRWRRMWALLAQDLGVEPAPYPGCPTPLADQMEAAGPIWEGIVRSHRLVPSSIDELASWWHTDADLGRPFEAFTDMTKSRRLGFLEFQESDRSFGDLFDRLRRERIIPDEGMA